MFTHRHTLTNRNDTVILDIFSGLFRAFPIPGMRVAPQKKLSQGNILGAEGGSSGREGEQLLIAPHQQKKISRKTITAHSRWHEALRLRFCGTRSFLVWGFVNYLWGGVSMKHRVPMQTRVLWATGFWEFEHDFWIIPGGISCDQLPLFDIFFCKKREPAYCCFLSLRR